MRAAGPLALALLGLPAAGNAPLPADLPAFAPEQTIPPPTVHRTTLPNGLQVWVVPRSGPPRVDFVLSLKGAGFTADPADRPAAAKLLAALLNEGTTQRSAQAIAEAAQGMGGAVGASAGRDGLTVQAHALASQAEPMLKLLAEVTRQASFPEAEVALARANALQALKAASADPNFLADGALGRAVYGDHPYARTQETEAGLQGITAEWLRTEHAVRFRPDRALLVIAGRVQPGPALRWARVALGDWKAQGAPRAVAPLAPASLPRQHQLIARAGSVQATLRLGRPGIPAQAEDVPALRLAGTILGGSFSSRINMNLREEKGYTYGAYAGDGTYLLGGVVMGGADVRNEVTGAAMAEYGKEFKRLADEPISAEEMAMNKRYVAGSYLLTMQMQAAVAQSLAGNWLKGLPPAALSDYVPAIQRVSAAQVQTMARRYFDPATFSWIVVGDPAQIAEQLKAQGPFNTP
ncbi:insulinase family protein [Inhella sp. 4Y17]|uniref:Insulinase family protein n=2 Tax=Inhella gelatinilytica TaxID=2795030 RepID=A0A931IRR0_9BURK|nr:insulinase family protein [Inhella gelatinilytica]